MEKEGRQKISVMTLTGLTVQHFAESLCSCTLFYYFLLTVKGLEHTAHTNRCQHRSVIPKVSMSRK